MNRNYIRGRAKEYRVKKKWESEGWTVFRTAGSHGEFDLIAIRRGTMKTIFTTAGMAIDGHRIALIQVKGGKSAKRELKKLEPLKEKYDGLYSVSVELV